MDQLRIMASHRGVICEAAGVLGAIGWRGDCSSDFGEVAVTDDDTELGPAMEALDDRRRKFVRAVIQLQQNGIENVAAAARKAGYSDKKEGCKVRGHALIYDVRIQAALLEEGRKRINAAAAVVATPVC